MIFDFQTNLQCSIISNTKAQQYFTVDPDTCVLSIKTSLENDPDLTTQYRVSFVEQRTE
jgi:hypothetical protein